MSVLEELKKEREGVVVKCRKGNTGVVKNYHRYNNVEVEWEDGLVTKHVWLDLTKDGGFFRSKEDYLDFKRSEVRKIVIGEVVETKSGWTLEIIEYLDAHNVKVRWQDGSEVWTNLIDIKNRSIVPLNKPSVFGVGVYGEGKYVPRNRKPREGQVEAPKAAFRSWQQLMKRMWSSNKHDRKNSKRYSHVSVCDEWNNFQNFCSWAVEQVGFDNVESNGRAWCLDKDILFEGNSIYSPDTCVFVPNEVNAFFSITTNDEESFGTNFIEPKFKNAKDGFISRCTNPITKEREYLGYFDTIREANEVYVKRKNEFARLLADKWDGVLDSRVIDSLNSFDMERRFKATLKAREVDKSRQKCSNTS